MPRARSSARSCTQQRASAAACSKNLTDQSGPLSLPLLPGAAPTSVPPCRPTLGDPAAQLRALTSVAASRTHAGPKSVDRTLYMHGHSHDLPPHLKIQPSISLLGQTMCTSPLGNFSANGCDACQYCADTVSKPPELHLWVPGKQSFLPEALCCSPWLPAWSQGTEAS